MVVLFYWQRVEAQPEQVGKRKAFQVQQKMTSKVSLILECRGIGIVRHSYQSDTLIVMSQREKNVQA